VWPRLNTGLVVKRADLELSPGSNLANEDMIVCCRMSQHGSSALSEKLYSGTSIVVRLRGNRVMLGPRDVPGRWMKPALRDPRQHTRWELLLVFKSSSTKPATCGKPFKQMRR
jgi:hypothetical protein